MRKCIGMSDLLQNQSKIFTKENLHAQINEINALVNKRMTSDNGASGPITDGIIDVEMYLSAKQKILWILKEPYDDLDKDGNPCGGGWDLPDWIRKKTRIQEFGKSQRTFKPMTYVSWGILNGFSTWDTMDYVEDSPQMLDALKSAAYINVKKLPGRTRSFDRDLREAFEAYKDILLDQVKAFAPDVVIGGNTLQYFLPSLGSEMDQLQSSNSVRHTFFGDAIWIHAYHPAQRPNSTGVSIEQYCNDIIAAARQAIG